MNTNISITDRVLYNDNKHKFHDTCERFFDWRSKKGGHYVVVSSGKFSKVEPVRYVEGSGSTQVFQVFGKVMACLLVFPPIIFGIGLLISRAKHHYQLNPSENSLSEKRVTPKKDWKSPNSLDETEVLSAFLKSPGFKREGANKIIDGYVRNPGLNQGMQATRELGAQLAKMAPETFSPSSLRALQKENPELIRCLQLKRYSHVFKIKGFADMGNKQFDLEGFSESFAIGMAHSTLLEFFKTADQSVLDQEDQKWISSALKNALYAETADEASMMQAKDRINGKSPEFQVIGLGWDWHAFYGLFYKDFILCNRGAGSTIQGIKIYKLPKDFKITDEQLKHVNRHEIAWESSHEDAGVTRRFNCENALIHRENRKDQEGGICCYANIKPLIYSLMAARWMIKHNKNFEDAEWKQAFQAVKPLYKGWSNYDKIKVLEDFAIDLKNSKKDPALKRALEPIVTGLKEKRRLVNGQYISKEKQNSAYEIRKELDS